MGFLKNFRWKLVGGGVFRRLNPRRVVIEMLVRGMKGRLADGEFRAVVLGYIEDMRLVSSELVHEARPTG